MEKFYKVLLIEDNPDHALIIQHLLANIKGFLLDLEKADSLSAGLECLSKGKIDVVLLDLSLPDSRGVDTFVRLHAQVPDVPVIVLTALSGIIALGLGDVLYMTSFKEVGVSRTVSIVATYPMFSLALEFLTGRGDVPLIAIAGTLLIFSGIWLLTRSGESVKDSIPSENIRKGLIAALGVAFLYSISMLLVDEALESLSTSGIESAFAVNALRTASGGAFLLITSPIMDRTFEFLRMKRGFIGLFLLGSLIAYGVGWYLLTWGFLLAPTSSVVPLSSTTPLFAAVLAVVILREPLKARGTLGILLIVIGIMLIVVG